MINRAGTYKGRVVGQVVLGKSAQKGTPQIQFYCAITQGEFKGDRAKWTGYFGPNSAGRTVESLQHCGWEGEELGEFADGELHGLDRNEVELVIDIEDYEVQVDDQETGETKTVKKSSPKIQWINDGAGAGRLDVQNAMMADEAAAFGEKMRGLVLKAKAKKPAPSAVAADSISFGHGQNVEPQRAAGARKGW